MWTDINLKSSSEESGPKKPIFKNDTDVLAVNLHIVHVYQSSIWEHFL